MDSNLTSGGDASMEYRFWVAANAPVNAVLVSLTASGALLKSSHKIQGGGASLALYVAKSELILVTSDNGVNVSNGLVKVGTLATYLGAYIEAYKATVNGNHTITNKPISGSASTPAAGVFRQLRTMVYKLGEKI